MDIILSASDLQFMDFIKYPQIDIERNSTTFICGESGCGKSTLLKLFNTTILPSSGKVLYNDKSIESMCTIALRKELILVSQSVFLFDGTIEDNFIQYYAFREEPVISTDEMKKYLSICCAEFPLDSKCEVMSGGERQRIFIAICISFLPKALMLDEPTFALDEKTSNCLFMQLKEFCVNNSITLITVSHDRALAASYADKIIVMEEGSLL